ncbi:hypothetical protein A3D66_00715 [Candidatus Kaiserbacteria bacterium RIFCSPHIGHO2_02_FULL_50_9]|nr:MAG: hypothetical protein A3D66_00715 [Candidatus Kaiserbacteria bacterium RIFCSPHIGHO2_02_FULL_50_9]
MELYHVLNRGVDKRTIFLDNTDRARFVHNLYEFNDVEAAGNSYRHFNKATQMMDLRGPSFGWLQTRSRKRIVDIHGWCIMGNHYHLLLSERVPSGISRFLMKLNVGYAKYFNERYERSGTLFQGRTKKVHITSDPHFLYILHYIHLNPLDFSDTTRDWRVQKITSTKKALAHLDEYRWSSYQDYCGTKNFPSLLSTSLFMDVFGNYREALSTYLHDMELEEIKTLTLE